MDAQHSCGKCGTDKVKVSVSDDGSWTYIVCETCQVTTYKLKKYFNPRTLRIISPAQYAKLVK